MGGKESKPITLSYEEAVKRVSESELSRLKDAYKRTATLNGSITKQAFIREVLGEGVPNQLAELIFVACGGTAKGIAFKDLLCSLVLLTRGNNDEKIKFIFGVYANEAGTHVSRAEMLRQLQATESGYTPEIVHKCFGQGDRVSYEEFRSWLSEHPEATTVTRWLLAEPCHVSLSNDLETPTFYQTLAGVTHLEETDILELEKRYWQLKGSSPSGKLDPETLVPLISPPLPYQLARGVFNAFDENRDNHIDFKEMACGISAACRGPLTERQKFCFKVFDRDRDGKLNRDELTAMIQALLLVQEEEVEEDGDGVCLGVSSERVQQLVSDLLLQHDPQKSGCISQEEYLIWTLQNPLSNIFLNLIFQVCHVVLGLRPCNRVEEGELVMGWLRRAEKKSMTIGQFWYIINMDWWNVWMDYVNYQANSESSMSPSSHSSSPAGSQCGSLKRTKLQKKSANSEGTVASDTSGILVTSIASLGAGDSVSLTSIESDGSSGRASDQTGSRQGSLQRHSTSTPKKNFSSGNLSLTYVESNRCSSNSSPSHSPRLARRAATSPGPLLPPSRPSAIDNSPLVEPNTAKVMLLTGEGGRLKRNIPLVQGRDFMLVPESLWKALQQWYGGAPALPRQVIHGRMSGEVELELYPVTLRLLRHQTSNQGRSPANNSWVGVPGGYGASAFTSFTHTLLQTPSLLCSLSSLLPISTASSTNNSAPYSYMSSLPNSLSSTPKRYLAYMAAFSRMATVRQVYDYLATKLRLRTEDMRLWHIKDETNMTLLEEEDSTLEELWVGEMSQVLIEVRNKDLTWPEEMSQIACKGVKIPVKEGGNVKGITGLNNLGNTCFLNAALQCCSNTLPLTRYFMSNMHLFELNRSNPCGMKGHMAKQYGNLIHEIWSGGSKTVAPLKLRWTIGKYTQKFAGFGQHDSQELLAFLLDGLHEDLNRVHNKPYIVLKDSEGRPDTLVAQEAWENHILRNKSIIVDLFHGQLKSKVSCDTCGNESVRFDPFTYLTLQLPMESCVYLEVIVMRLDGSVPVKYGLRLNSDARYSDIKRHLHPQAGIHPHHIMLTELANAQVKCIPMDEARVRNIGGITLFAYELPSVVAPQASEVRSASRSTKDRQLFTHIQRSTHHSAPCIRENGTSNSSSDTKANQASTLEPVNPSSHSSNQECYVNGRKDSDSSLSSGSSGPPSSLQSISGPPSSASSLVQHENDLGNPHKGFIVAFHRKMMRQEVYFLSSQKTRPSLFGLPLVVPCSSSTTHQDLYESVWTQVSRLVSPLPPSESSGPNHAHDCDDSMGYEFPFTLRVVDREGMQCAWCPWYRFCRGCELPCDDCKFPLTASFLAIDWDPTALHLRYQSAAERVFRDDSSVDAMRRKHVEPISLADCLEAFCSEETLEYLCDKCKKLQQAKKKLQIWRLPPILIVHLKRFQYLNNKWVKSQKIVQFPLKDFDPTNYLASVPRQTLLMHRAELEGVDPATYLASLPEKDNVFLEMLPENKVIEQLKSECEEDRLSVRSNKIIRNGSVNSSINGSISILPTQASTPSSMTGTPESSLRRAGLERRRVRNGSVLYGDTLQDFHQHRLMDSSDPLDLKYSLYAIACHSGIMEGGHYVCYAKNSEGKWICFNDSSCKEVPEAQIDLNSAYLLFYSRENLSIDKYMPNVDGKVPDFADLDEEAEAEYKKQCTVM